MLFEDRKTVNIDWYTEVGFPQVFEKLCSDKPRSGLRGTLLPHNIVTADTAAKILCFFMQSWCRIGDSSTIPPTTCHKWFFKNFLKNL